NDGGGDKLYITGNVQYVRDSANNLVATLGVASWDGTTLARVGFPPNAIGSAWAAHDEDGAGPNPTRVFLGSDQGVFRWDSGAWSQVISGEDIGPQSSLASFGGNLYAGSGGLFRWDGSSWSIADAGLAGPLLAAEISDGEARLFATSAAGQIVSFD